MAKQKNKIKQTEQMRRSAAGLPKIGPNFGRKGRKKDKKRGG